MPIAAIVVLSAASTSFFLWLALYIEKLTWGGPVYYPRSHLERQSNKFPEIIIQCLVIITIAYTIYYLCWRLSILNPEVLGLSWILWGAEAYGFITFLLFSFMNWRLCYPKKPSARQGISVDVFVPTCGEPIDVLRATLVGCTRIKYPHQTFVLDDSARPEVEALSINLGCEYISRPTHEGAKAGNINYALERTSGEMIVVLDADHIPLPDILHNTLGFFDDSEVAIVQGPQLFYNLDSFQHEDSAWHEQRIFFQVIQPGKNRNNSAFWCGTPSVLRRSAIEAVGGVAQDTVTEDLHTTLKLIKSGYHVLYTEQALAVGLSPATIGDYLGQRFRWGQGAMQTLRGKDSPFWTKGLTFSQRLNFIASTITYFDGLQVLVLAAIPLITLFTGLLPISSIGLDFITRFIPYLALLFLTNILLSRGTYSFWNIERYSLLRSFTFVSTLATFITGKAHPFYVTRKEAGGNNDSSYKISITPHLITIVLCIAGVAVGITHIYHPLWYQQGVFPIAIATVWVLLNAVLLIESVSRIFGVSHRARYRFPVVTEIKWRRLGEEQWQIGYSINLSTTGIYFEHSEFKVDVGDKVEIAIAAAVQDARIPDGQGMNISEADEAKIRFTGHVVNSHIPSEQVNQRLGVCIDKFNTESDINNYSYLVHNPAHLLDGERLFLPQTEQPDNVEDVFQIGPPATSRLQHVKNLKERLYTN